MTNVNAGLAIIAGLVSFFSPCCLPLYPAYLSYMTGLSARELEEGRHKAEVRYRTVGHTLAFVLGFSVVFYSLGASVGLLGEWFENYRDTLRVLAGLLILFMALVSLGVVRPLFLMREHKLRWTWKPAGYAGSFVIGIGFAAGWSPCIGPMLTAIIALAAVEHHIWFKLMTGYALGFAIPFFALALLAGSVRLSSRYTSIIMKTGGVLLVITGILLVTDRMTEITLFLQRITPDWLLVM
ncbi:cytochrome c biogenesis CcdA family protein [Paenibacillus farraposensis]|uniref:Cytochrome c biogenesis CcdA family protein n=1 Tax=Paenibacillus farraposensis TaxID=2807095 RepID=A0ABW4DC53_9BACL|nr:cytochrome c biogenesis protein CcdA [Paenibacillus farraposensis]MCC3379742.1 sulfite exporter TauE/SafE family protein [Paenibacillus farraposensis]